MRSPSCTQIDEKKARVLFARERERENTTTRQKATPRKTRSSQKKRSRDDDDDDDITIIISRTAFASSVRSDRSKTVVPLLLWWSSRFCDDAPRVSSPRTLSRLPRRSPGRRRAGRRRARWTRSARRAMDAFFFLKLYSVVCMHNENEETNTNGILRKSRHIRKTTQNRSLLIP